MKSNHEMLELLEARRHPDTLGSVSQKIPSPARFVISRAQEENWAAKNCRMTKILGWAMIATFVFTIVSAFFTDHLYVDILMIIGGIAVLKGSQAWVRFYFFLSLIAFVYGSGSYALKYITGEPIELTRKWVNYRSVTDLAELLVPLGLMLGMATLCFFTLKARRLVFWTSTARKWVGGIVILTLIVLAIGGFFKVRKAQENAAVRKEIETELVMVRNYVMTHGGRYSSYATEKLQQDLAKKNSRIRRIIVRQSPGSSMVLFSQDLRGTKNAAYSEFIERPSGKWYMIEVNLLRDD